MRVALLLAAAIGSSVSHAGNPVNGQSLYQTWCAVCHGPARDNQNGILAGANRPDVILAALASIPDVQVLLTVIPNPPEAADDLAAYLALVASVGIGSGGLQVPAAIDLGAVTLGQESLPAVLTLTNTGTVAVNVINVSGTLPAEFPILGSTCVGVIAPGADCRLSIAFRPAKSGSRSALINVFGNVGPSPQAIVVTGKGLTPGASSTVPVVEFYNKDLDHYFISSDPAEIAELDAGTRIKGWILTSFSFRAYPPGQAGASPVCRFYLPPQFGDSHFFGRGTAECEATEQKYPGFDYESPEVMDMILPAIGTCPANTIPVYRVFSNRSDTNHRYTTDRAIRDQMVEIGWMAEGDGADFVVMCSPL